MVNILFFDAKIDIFHQNQPVCENKHFGERFIGIHYLRTWSCSQETVIQNAGFNLFDYLL